jgi:hypothetical protein
LESFGVDSSVDNPEELDQAGWGILFPADFEAGPIKEALAPLLERRKQEAGALFHVFEGTQGVQRGESATDWLARQGEGPGLAAVDPTRGVPFYIMIVAPPDAIPMSFQYLLDIFWAVGRLHFENLDDYSRYAAAIVEYETTEVLPQTSKRAALFATEHPGDGATSMFTRDVAAPFLDTTGAARPLGRKQGFSVASVMGDNATKAGLLGAMRGDGAGAPALLFSGTHGMSFRKGNPRQAACQGALVCQDWEGFGAIKEDDWFSASDVPADLRLNGMVHFLFACYGGGWESFDTFRDGPDGTAQQIADRPGMSQLPQAILSRGAMCVVAHVDRAWSYSFRTPNGKPQSAPIRDVLTRIMQGSRVGNALDQFNAQWAALSVPIADKLRDFQTQSATGKELAHLWIARDDVRNYTVLGDPAARVRVDRMTSGI